MARKQTSSLPALGADMSARLDPIFSHPEGIEWYWDDDTDRIGCELPSGDAQSFDVIEAALVHLPALMARYSPWQIATGFEFIFNPVLSSYANLFADDRIVEPRRTEAAANLFGLFGLLFREAAAWTFGPEHLLRESPAGTDPVQRDINRICYMFWDTSRLLHLGLPGVRRACLDVMERCLTVPNYAVQESALHGLGHLARDDARAAALAAGFAARGMGPPELIRYAQAAAVGHVL